MTTLLKQRIRAEAERLGLIKRPPRRWKRIAVISLLSFAGMIAAVLMLPELGLFERLHRP